MKKKFKVGDIVEWGGVLGEVIENTPINTIVVFKGVSHVCHFNLDGKSHRWHIKPSLKLIKRPRNKIKKTIERWVNVYSAGFSRCFDSRDEAILHRRPDCISTVVLQGKYEVKNETQRV